MDMTQKRLFATLDPFLEGGEIMGRAVANTGFLEALLRADPFDGYHFFLPGLEQCQGLERQLTRRFPELSASGRVALFTRLELPARLASTRYHCFHLSDCITSPAWLARLRNSVAPELFPVTSMTHTLSYPRYAQDFLAHLWPGTSARDVVVASSRAGQAVLLAAWKHLREAYGLDFSSFPQPAVERIPLGFDCDRYVPAEPDERQALREAQGIRPGQTALLALGRLSHSSKMDLLPLLRAVQRLLREGLDPASIRLVLAGWVRPGDDYPGTLRALARNLGVELVIEASPSEQAKLELLRAADIFVSPSDNLQETFGLTLLEAQAMGLPVLVSDWDGYRDLVEDGVTGLLIPTIGPADTDFADRLGQLWFDNQHHLLLAQSTAVDVSALAKALGGLLADPQRRAAMGRAGRDLARRFDWPRIVERYVALWDDLWTRPVDEAKARAARHPLQMPAGRVFAAHPSRHFGPELRVRWSQTGQAVYRGRDAAPVYAGVQALLDPEALRTALFLARAPIAATTLAERLAAAKELDAEQARFLVLWALKQDLLERVESDDLSTGREG